MNETPDPRAFLAEVGARASEFLAHDRWSRAQIQQYQQERLRALLAHVAQASPYYRELLRGRSPAEVALSELPTLNKATLMAEFDRIVTAPELRLRDVEAHVQGPHAGQPFLGKYHVFASSGTSGRRGLIVQERGEFAFWVANVLRVFARVGIGPDTRLLTIGAPYPLHVTQQLAAALRKPGVPVLHVGMPLAELSAELNAYQPEALASYAGILCLLAQAQLEGKLTIAPRAVLSTAEVLTPATRELIHTAWGIWPANAYASTEVPCVACSLPQASTLFVYDDLHILEVVGADGRAVPSGTPGARVLITNLFSWTQPLIRYELGDSIALAEYQEGSALPFQRLLSIDGRSDDILRLPARAGGTIAVHPYTLRLPFAELRDVTEYQLRHSEEGLEVRLVLRPGAAPETPGLARAALLAALESAGAIPPAVTTVSLPALAREGMGAKLKLVQALPPP
jgi:putative adenylate-forming enzyme